MHTININLVENKSLNCVELKVCPLPVVLVTVSLVQAPDALDSPSDLHFVPLCFDWRSSRRFLGHFESTFRGAPLNLGLVLRVNRRSEVVLVYNQVFSWSWNYFVF
ncbi:hypothetical protein BgiBS90_022890 [Biomphalaria glabrata]|nr:hypothetical protein BgiBS90_022890 [Biomphalaria glabrata]